MFPKGCPPPPPPDEKERLCNDDFCRNNDGSNHFEYGANVDIWRQDDVDLDVDIDLDDNDDDFVERCRGVGVGCCSFNKGEKEEVLGGDHEEEVHNCPLKTCRDAI
mmetsp:Transcript_9559/g.14680  ORF Transcript_9559/g.14680 Transcript_9559/m.14680 type:complete len:106 (+) Transcript_9559:181-498(+)